MEKVRVAAVQVRSRNSDPWGNLDHAAPYVAEAARESARLVLCPEFLATGYVYSNEIWDAAEPTDGSTERWLQDLSRRHGIYVGASYLEASGGEFFNTFTLTDPGGEVAGRVRKGSLPFFEGWFFKPCDGPKFIDTALGRIGVGICNDNQTAGFLAHMLDARPDIILMPHSAPTPVFPGGRAVAEVFDTRLVQTARWYARSFGVPTLLSNKVSGEVSETPVPIMPFARLRWRFRGSSSLCDASGRLLDSRFDREGLVMGDIAFEPSRKRRPTPGSHGYWSFEPPPFGRVLGTVLQACELAGKHAYNTSRARQVIAATAAP